MVTMGARPSAVSLPSHLPMYPRLLNRGRGRSLTERQLRVIIALPCPFSRSQVSQSSNLKKRLGKASCLPTRTFTGSMFDALSPNPHIHTPHIHTHPTHSHIHTHPTHSTHSHTSHTLHTFTHTPHTPHIHTHTGFWGYSDSEGSDLDLPAVTPLNNEDKDDFDFYG